MIALMFSDWGTLGSETLECDTLTKIGHFRAKWTQNFSILYRIRSKNVSKIYILREIFSKKIENFLLNAHTLSIFA